MMKQQTISGIYDNGVVRLGGTIRLGRKLPIRNHTRLRFVVELPYPSSPVMKTFGLIRVPKRLAKLIAESPEFSVLNS